MVLLLSACSSSDRVTVSQPQGSATKPAAPAEVPSLPAKAAHTSETRTHTESATAFPLGAPTAAETPKAEPSEPPQPQPAKKSVTNSFRQAAIQGMGLKINDPRLFRLLSERGSGMITLQHGKILSTIISMDLNQPWCQFVSVTTGIDPAAIYTFAGVKSVSENAIGFKLNGVIVGVCSSGAGRDITLDEFREVSGRYWTVIH